MKKDEIELKMLAPVTFTRLEPILIPGKYKPSIIQDIERLEKFILKERNATTLHPCKVKLGV